MKKIQLPKVTQNPDGSTLTTYSDGNWKKTEHKGDFLLTTVSWDYARDGIPEAVREGDLALMEEAGRQVAYHRELGFLGKVLGF